MFLTSDIEGAPAPGHKPPEHRIEGEVFKHPDSVGSDTRHRLNVLAFDLATGRLLWERTAYEGTVFDDRHKRSSYAAATPVTDGTYVGFMVLTICGAVLALFLCNAGKVRRDDGSKVILMKNPSWKTEFKGLLETITQAPWVVLLFPMFFASSALYPLWKMREGSLILYYVCLYNPFTWAVELIRFAFYLKMNWEALGVVVGCTVVFLALSVWAYDPSRGIQQRKAAAAA